MGRDAYPDLSENLQKWHERLSEVKAMLKNLQTTHQEYEPPKSDSLPRLSFTGRVQMEAAINPHRALIMYGSLMEVRYEMAKLGRGRF